MSKRNPPAPPAGNPPAPDSAAQVILYGSNIHPATLTIGDREYQLGDFVRDAHALSGLSAEDWNALSEDERHERIDGVIVELGGPSFLPDEQDPPPPPPPLEDDGLVDLHGPENCGDVSHGGNVYECKDGKVRVPHEAVAALKAHGFTVAPARGKAEE